MVRFTLTAKAALLVAASAFPLQAAFAQDAAEAAAEDEGDIIIVSGSIVQSIQSSVEEKRRAVNITDIASADDVGRFPDENIAAALARLPGVATQLDQGQARYIQVRGAPNRWTSVSIDGIPQTGTDEASNGRAFRFDAIPAVILSQLRVNKSLTPDITAEAVTANVDLVTYSPLSDEGLTLSGDLGYGFMDLGNGEQRQGSLRLGYSEETWGLVIGGSHYRREQITDNREANYSIGTDGNLAPQDIDVRNYFTDRETNGLYGSFEYQPVSGQRFFVNAIWSEFTDDEQRNAYEFDIGDRGVVGTRTATGGDLVNVGVAGAFNDGSYRNRNLILASGADLQFDDWGVKFMLGYTNTTNTTRLPLTLTDTTGANNVSLTYDRSDPRFPIITGLFTTVFDPVTGAPSRGAPITSFDQMSFNSFSFVLPIITRTSSDSFTGRLDVYKEFDNLTIRAGSMLQVRDIAGNIFNDAGIVPLATLGQDINSYVTDDPWITGFPLGVNFTYTDNEQLNIDQEAALDRLGINLFDLNPPQDFFFQQETIFSNYVMGEFDLGALQVVAGLRTEYYETTNRGTADIGGALTPLSFTQDFFDFFPSVNITYELTPDILVRVGGMRGVARPAYAATRIGASIDDVGNSISAGNPSLVPEYTWGLDGSIEWYLPTNGIISVAVFRRWVEDVLFTDQGIVGTDAFNSDGIDRSGYFLFGENNGENGTVTGVEFNIEHQLDFLPGFLSGFGVQGNLTLLDGEFDAISPVTGVLQTEGFPGLSDTIVNVSGFYEKYGFSARVAYQWRSDFIDTIGGLGIGAGESRGAFENLDVTLRYQFNENFAVFADMANLTNEVYTAFQGTSDFPAEVEQIGSRYLFGIRFDF